MMSVTLNITGDNNVITLDPNALAELPEGDRQLIAVSQVELDQILASLRLWQHCKAEDIPLEIQEIACNGRESSMADGEIDILCEAING